MTSGGADLRPGVIVQAVGRGRPTRPTEFDPAPLDFAPVEGRTVVAGFDGGAITSNAGALLLGATDRAIDRSNGCKQKCEWKE